jgi:glycosyltransferase involved in cell wall biosynthesis
MNVLLADFDLYDSVGGGQTVYKRLIETNREIRFYYFGRKEATSALRPANATMVPWQEVYSSGHLTGEFSGWDAPLWAFVDFLWCANLAASVAHIPLDVVDIPDYKVHGYLVAPALRSHGQKSCRVVLALHGNLSETQVLNWGGADAWANATADQREQWQYRVADIRYGLSRDYLDHWAKLGGIEGHYLNPLQFVPRPKVVPYTRKEQGLALNFIGRTEGFKGPDLFLELLGWLPRGSYRDARLIGPPVLDKAQLSSTEHLQRMADRRGLKVEIVPPMSRIELEKLYSTRSITVLPSRMDTFNLVALESLFAGCPTAISTKAGVCRFIRESWPALPYTALDVDKLYGSAPALLKAINEYDHRREELAKVIAGGVPEFKAASLETIYGAATESEHFLRSESERMYLRLEAFYFRHRTRAYDRLTTTGIRVCDALRTQTESKVKSPIVKEGELWAECRDFFYAAENTPAQIDVKVAGISRIAATCRIDRARVWAEMARLERLRGNDFVAATYDIRVMRALGEDRLGRLPLVVAELRHQGFPKEAEAVIALYGPSETRVTRGRALLESARTGHRAVPERAFELVEDTRAPQRPKVSIIVSLYRAADKFETFVNMLAQQPWVQSDRAELVFVDSHSPTDEHRIFKAVAAAVGLKAVYARTSQRETIQTAWNRGILLARGEYLSFLGADEMVRPDCFGLLAAELDADPKLDWVQGNALITEVDQHGTHVKDVMLYQRIPYEQDLVRLETCYLSWVGGMYRKDIHDRFGYYDETFGAAGDTEFKNRILPWIRSKTLPLTLGVFLNYPEVRTTQSPRAEIEDLRAWYLHRSVAGVEYALTDRSAVDALMLFRKAINYRKSYLGHLSSDLDYAWAVAEYSASTGSNAISATCADAVARTLNGYRELDWLPTLSPRSPTREKLRVETLAATQAQRVTAELGRTTPPDWRIFNDNRHEQHFFVWPGRSLAESHQPGTRFAWCQSARTAINLDRRDSTDDAPSAAIGAQAIAKKFEHFESAGVRLVAEIRTRSQAARMAGDAELSRNLEIVAEYLRRVATGNDAAPIDGQGAGSLLTRLFADCYAARGVPPANVLDDKFRSLCVTLTDLITAICPELGDAFDGLAEYAGNHLEQKRSLEVAARILSCKDPLEAIKRHRPDLSAKVLDTLQRAADSAKVKGNIEYSARLNLFATAIKAEMAAVQLGA